MKQLPLFTPSEFALIVPPFCSTSCLQIWRPKPIPSELISAVRYSFPNFEKSYLRSNLFIPIPVSLTLAQSKEVCLSYHISTLILPLGVNLRAFLIKFMSSCYRRVTSPNSKGSFSSFSFCNKSERFSTKPGVSGSESLSSLG